MDLKAFLEPNLFDACNNLFAQLGIELNSNTKGSLPLQQVLGALYRHREPFTDVDCAYFLGLIDASVFQTQDGMFAPSGHTFEEAVDITGNAPDYSGMMVFALDVKQACTVTRSEMAELARVFNRKTNNLPVIILIREQNQLSLLAVERIKYARTWRQGEKMGKVSLLFRIDCRTSHTGHIKILEDLRRKADVRTFDDLYKQWRTVFDVQVLNKKFYQEVANWYFWALTQIEFPIGAGTDPKVRNATSLIRLLTRLIFVWFLKEKRLVPEQLFYKKYLDTMLNYTDKTGSTYYKAILQNLFFATLNTPMQGENNQKGRVFIDDAPLHGYLNDGYMQAGFFRYKRYMNNPDALIAAYSSIPFLNGGLFECLDQRTDGEPIRVDCFSDNPKNEAKLKVPDELFFGGKTSVDLNPVYETKNKEYYTRGLIHILDSYKFTVAENTPVEEEIALDPELLGKVFENLLASYNPETGTTARKATGSFYTPREIVNYMVDESLTAYLENKLVEQASLLVDNNQKDNESTIGQSGMIDQPDEAHRKNSLKEFTITQRHLPHWQNPGSVYFITFRTYQHLILDDKSKDIIADSITFHDKKKYNLFSYVIMPDHVHIILQPKEIRQGEYYNLSEVTHSIKSYSANEINKRKQTKASPVWQHESWDRIIRNDEELYEKMNYILNNPVKKGIVESGYDYKWHYHSGQSSNSHSSNVTAHNHPVEQASLLVDNNQNDNEIAIGQSGMIDLPFRENLRHLLSYTDEPHHFSKHEVSILLDAIEHLKILDPACGSGAFPMGVLHKVVYILHKLDPENKIWKQKLIDRTPSEIREETRKALENKPLDYVRKLGLIENCIYGVDIQPIAIQITKLRFFISLIVEQKTDDAKPNRDIKALPNLETKFVAANTLIGLEKPNAGALNFTSPEVQKAETELFGIRRDLFYSNSAKEKKRLQAKEQRARMALRDALQHDNYATKTAEQIAAWDPFDQQASSGWFDPEFMFGIADGFDVVIGNPPYGAELKPEEKTYIEVRFNKNKSKNKNSAIYFIFVSDVLLKETGVNSFIVPKSLSYSQGWNACADFLLPNLIGFHDTGKSFENVLLEMVVFVKKKGNLQSYYKTGVFDQGSFLDFGLIEKDIYLNYRVILTFQSNLEFELLITILNKATNVWGDYLSIDRGLNWQSKASENKGRTPIYRGAQLNKYCLDEPSDFISLNKFNNNEYAYQLQPKILNQLAIAHVKKPYPHFFLQAHLDLENNLVYETISCSFSKSKKIDLQFLLAINNSKLFAWLLYKFIYNNAIRSTRYDEQYVSKIPCPNLGAVNQQPFITIVDQILTAKKNNPNADTTSLEKQIDDLVYKLYDLTEEEIAIVEGRG